MEVNNLLSSGLILTALAGVGWSLFSTLKGIPNQIYRKIRGKLIHIIRIYDNDALYYVLEKHMTKFHADKCREADAGYYVFKNSFFREEDENDFIRSSSRKKEYKIGYKQSSGFFTMKYKGKRLLVTKSKEKIEHATGKSELHIFHFKITGWLAKRHITEFLEEITEEYNASLRDTDIRIHKYGGYEWEEVGKKSVKPISKVIINSGLKSHLLDDMKEFENRKKWYKEVGITHKRSYLFYGPPGTGKTTIALAIASELGRDVAVASINGVEEARFTDQVMNMPPNTVFLIEDVDSYFNGRECVGNNKISFSTFINALDGAVSKDNSIIVITTNHIERLDPALLRAGRVDYKMEIPIPRKEEIEEYLKLFYNKDFYIPEEEYKVTMSLVQESCIRNMNNAEKAILDLLEANNQVLAKTKEVSFSEK